MRMYDIILKKRNGGSLSKEEIEYFVEGYTNNRIPDYQVSVLLMSIYFKGMNTDETVSLTDSMMKSGDVIDLSGIDGIVVDKHSTGGVGDTTTLILAPLVASCDVAVAKMSGRGLGHTGGTIDKLESIKGFNAEISMETFIDNANRIKIALAGQTGKLAPADKKLYALRDVTATVDQLSLIASSIMSKKLASGSDAILLDVKVGSGAFMKTPDEAFELARIMVDIGNGMGKDTKALITDMEQPLGRAVGNAIEVKEAIRVLQGKSKGELLEVCLALGSELLVMAGKTENIKDACRLLEKNIENGRAYEKFLEFVIAQGGDREMVLNPEKLPQGRFVTELKSGERKYVKAIDGMEVGNCALVLGAGRDTKDSQIDLGAGIYIHKKVGEKIEKGEVIASLFGNDVKKLEAAASRLENAFSYDEKPVEKRKLIYGIASRNGVERY
ncbi:pyrimidine-nucleoside phosphorylase [Alkalibacter saccharofermentans]|uniref:Pyrimidine-nucleoside phosphorylase n=1 Tax=Alkalibacter saccharofermentans DSM 14828 TaxID=1120975 RepID=A0A1M4XEQ3_9FIRM|nr:pyrimidine-nucleoside phosphorylase [Alkalibacter saccharofermentans]SHE91975.1 pyrimidine-nucleoside phosphorylase [Alkalibacter saccharofermentans DSM 14828]